MELLISIMVLWICMRIPKHHGTIPALSLFLILSTGILIPASGLDFGFQGSGNASTEIAKALYVDTAATISHHEGPVRLDWTLAFENSERYPAPFMGSFFGSFGVDIRRAGISYDAKPFSLYLGKLPLRDEIDSPYSLFLSGAPLSAMTGGYRYEGERFSFSNRWIGLDASISPNLYKTPASTGIYADRGAVVKTYAISFGKFRFGYQDSIVYCGSYFDIDSFANPAPSFFVQYVASAAGKPGSRSSSPYANQNTLMGFFGDYEGAGWYAYAQVLVDDFNMNRFLNPDDYQNPDKIAWSAGGTCELPLGKLGLYTAGATKYTFQSAGDKEPYYSYTTHAGSGIVSGSSVVAVPIEDQMLGYLHGENNVAGMATWNATIAGFDLGTSLEFVVSGSKAPTNPWNGAGNWDTPLGGTKLLDDPVLEYKTIVGLGASRAFGDFTVFARGRLGYIANRLNAVYGPASPQGNLEPIYTPGGASGVLAEVSVGGAWRLRP